MDRFRQLEVFVAVAEVGGFAKAAMHLRSSPPAVTRVIAALERRLGVHLFSRTTRTVGLTEAGRRYLERARWVLSGLNDADNELIGELAAPSGHLTITAPVTMGRSLLPRIVTSFLKEHPRMTAKVLLLDRVVNLIEEGIDLGLRVGSLPDSSLIARQVGEVRRVLVASPAYLKSHEAPKTPADLKAHAIIAFTGLASRNELRFGRGRLANRVKLAPRFEINDAPAAIAAAEQGEGIMTALSYMVAGQLRSGRLLSVLDRFAPPPVPVRLVYPESRLVAPKVRAFIDYAAPRLRAALEHVDASTRSTKGRTLRQS